MGVVNTKERRNSNNDDTLPSEFLSNSLNELQILEGHKDIVRLLVVLDQARIASASDDGTIMIWNYQTGVQIFALSGHTRPITCLLLLDLHTLISGSSDRTIRVWNIDTGSCEHTIENAHDGSVQCLTKLESGSETKASLFCSGGNDLHLKVWEFSSSAQTPPVLLGSMERQEEENLHCLLPISEDRVVTGSNSSFLFVYNRRTFQFDKLLAYHRESVRCLVTVNDALFASGSLDGSVVVWQADSLAPLKVLDYPEKYYENHIFTNSINHITVLTERYIGAAVGRGFKVFDISTGDCVAECKDGHDANVTRILSMYNRTRIVSCSADSSIKLWGAQLGGTSQKTPASRYAFGRLRAAPTQPVCLGDMWGHSDAVYDMVALSDSALCSCGADGLVILWKDGREQTEIRNQMAAISLMQNLLLEPPTDEPEETLALDLSAPIAPSETPQGRRSRANSTRRPRKPSLTSPRTKHKSPLKASRDGTPSKPSGLNSPEGQNGNAESPERMTVSDSQVQFSSQQKRRITLTYRATLDLEMEAGATLQDSGAFDLRQESNKSEEFGAVEYTSDESEMSSSTGDLYSTHSGLSTQSPSRTLERVVSED